MGSEGLLTALHVDCQPTEPCRLPAGYEDRVRLAAQPAAGEGLDLLKSALRQFVTTSERYGHHDLMCPGNTPGDDSLSAEAHDALCTCGFIRRMYETWILADDCGLDGYSIQASVSRERLARWDAALQPASEGEGT